MRQQVLHLIQARPGNGQVATGNVTVRARLIQLGSGREVVLGQPGKALFLALQEAQPCLGTSDLRFQFSRLKAKGRILDRSYGIAPGDLDVAERAFAVAEQQRAEAEASLTLARTQLDYSRIHSPISGVVGSVSTSRGTVTGGNSAGDGSVGVDVGTVSVGGTATITFRVTIDNPLPVGVTSIANQGTRKALAPEPAAGFSQRRTSSGRGSSTRSQGQARVSPVVTASAMPLHPGSGQALQVPLDQAVLAGEAHRRLGPLEGQRSIAGAVDRGAHSAVAPPAARALSI